MSTERHPAENDAGLPDCEGWTCQSCGADNFIPAGFARISQPVVHPAENDAPREWWECYTADRWWLAPTAEDADAPLARAWDEGFAARAEYDRRRDVPTNWPELNPYRDIPPVSTEADA